LAAWGVALPFLRHGERSVAGHNLVTGTDPAPDPGLRPAIALKSNTGQIWIIQILEKSAAHST
jgi:hypothetical protein